MATIKNLVIDQGTTFSLTVTVSDANVNPLNLTGYTVRAQMRKSYGATSYTAFAVIVGSPPTAGEVIISLTAAQTTGLKAGRYVYDIEIVSPAPDSVVSRVLEGIVTITPEVTR